MSTFEKQMSRLLSLPRDYTFEEAQYVASHFHYEQMSKGKTSGSRVMFYRKSDGKSILLHKPHPQNTMKLYSVRDFIETLKRNGDIK